tara:strand:- start:472 stop:759 length:288 start_codon:yes stop_codon:yes gene_type:complete
MKQKVRLYNLDVKNDEGIELYILRTEIGAHPDNVSYLREQYIDPSEFEEFYDEEDFETTYFSNGTWAQTDLLTNISTFSTGKEVSWDLIDIELSE